MTTMPPNLHPDAMEVWSPTWDVTSPATWNDGTVTVELISKRMNEDPDKDASDADRIAAQLVHEARFVKSFVTLFNRQAVRHYVGTGLTALATRRG